MLTLIAFVVLSEGAQQRSFAEAFQHELATRRGDYRLVWQSFASDLAAQLNAQGVKRIDEKRAERMTAKVAEGIDESQALVAVEEVFPAVGHESACFVVPHLWDARTEVDGLMTGWARILAYREEGRWRAQLIEASRVGKGSVMIGEAAYVSGKIVAIGRMHNGGNWPAIGAAVYEEKDGEWRQTQFVATTDEGATWTRLAWAKGGKLKPVTVEMRVYPQFLNVPHAGPLVRTASTWTFDGIRWSHTSWTRLDTVVAVVDDLLVGANSGKWALVRSRCTSDALANRIIELYKVDEPSVVVQYSPKSYDAKTDTELTLHPHYATLRFKRVDGRLKLHEIELP